MIFKVYSYSFFGTWGIKDRVESSSNSNLQWPYRVQVSVEEQVPECSVRLPHHLWQFVFLYPLLHQKCVRLEIPANTHTFLDTSGLSHSLQQQTSVCILLAVCRNINMAVCVCVCVCSGVSPLHHEWIFLLHGELRVDLDGIVFILQLQQLLPTVLRHQLAVFNNIWNKEEEWQRYNSCSEQAREPQPNTDTESLNEDRHWL